MACSTSGFARPDLAMLDCYLVRFFQSLLVTYGSGTGLWICRTGSADRWVGLARTRARQANQMGTRSASTLALVFHASDSWVFPLEFSLAAVFSFGSRGLRGRSVASATEIIRLRPGYGGQADSGYRGALARHRYRHRDANPAYGWVVRFPFYMDLSWTGSVLVPVDTFVAWL